MKFGQVYLSKPVNTDPAFGAQRAQLLPNEARLRNLT